jgi:hypothetical protein
MSSKNKIYLTFEHRLMYIIVGKVVVTWRIT